MVAVKQPHGDLALDFSVATVLDSYVTELEEERLPDGFWHPSSLFGCARRAVYDYLGTPKPPLDSRTKRVFRMGHIIHEFLQAAILRAVERGDLLQGYVEVKVFDPERGLKGHADGLVQLPDGTWVVLELKSIKSTGMKYGDLPKDDHRKQAAAYVSILRRHGGLLRIDEEANPLSSDRPGWKRVYMPFLTGVEEDGETKWYDQLPPIPELSHVAFVYVSKDDMEIREFIQVQTDQKEAWLDDYLARLRRHVSEGTQPRRLERVTEGRKSGRRHYLCGYCPFEAKCWNEDQEGIE